MCKELVIIAWDEIGGNRDELSFSDTTIKIPFRKEYIKTIKSEEVRKWISANIRDFYFKAQVDIHVMIRNKFVLGIECKAIPKTNLFRIIT